MVTETLVNIYADGGCRGNPGPGGWGVLMQSGENNKELWGGEANTTNNRMELTAVIRALEALKRPTAAHIHTDSQYVAKRHQPVDPQLETQRLAYRRQETGQER